MNLSSVPYKLEQHLKEICAQYKEYEDLLSTFLINKKSCTSLLANVSQNYPHYTEHGCSHSESIISNIEMLLGEESIRRLEPTDTWLLLQVAYMHDLGMVILYDNIKETWCSEKFQKYLKKLETSSDIDLQKAAQYITNFFDKMQQNELELDWPLSIKKYVTIIISDYYRGQHSSLSRKYLSEYGAKWGLDLEFNGLIQERLMKLLGEIAYLHTEDAAKVLELDYLATGFNSDYIHPRFIAEMLRMGDILDADNNRMNLYTEKVVGQSPESSAIHKRKHHSVTHMLITPELIEYRADCQDTATYREARNFLTWLKRETEFLALNWLDIMPKDFNGTAPKIGSLQIYLNGNRDIAGISDLRFHISEKKAFEIIEGSNLYANKFIFIREIIQNALDACKIQLWRDIEGGNYSAWIPKEKSKYLNPYEIPREIYKNYKVEVGMRTLEDGNIEVVIRDNGIGITVERLKEMCNVGVSYSGREQMALELDEMPQWLKPTAGFGIGLQSIFLVSTYFEIISRTSSGEIHAIVESGKENGYVQLMQSNQRRYRGTDIRIVIDKNEELLQVGLGEQPRIHGKYYDPLTNENEFQLYRLSDIIGDYLFETFFPIEVSVQNHKEQVLISRLWWKMKNWIETERYMYKWGKNGFIMTLWDKKTFTYFKLALDCTQKSYKVSDSVRFKGVVLEDYVEFQIYEPRYMNFTMDLYGLDTKETLTLDRRNVKPEANIKIQVISRDAIEFYKQIMWEEIQEQEQNGHNKLFNCNTQLRNEILTNYWYLCDNEKRIKLINNFSKVYNKVKIDVTTLVWDEEECIYKCEIVDFKVLIKELNKVAYIKPDSDFALSILDLDRDEEEKKNKIIKYINERKSYIHFTYIVIDYVFSDTLYEFYKRSMLISGEEKRLILLSCSDKVNARLEIKDEETRENIRKALRFKFSSNPFKMWFYGSERAYMSAIEDYPSLCTTRKLGGLATEININDVGYIIFPYRYSDITKMNKIEIQDFIELIQERADYKRLLEYVYENQIQESYYSKEQINADYVKLMQDALRYF